VAREPHELQHELPFLSVMVAIAWANRLCPLALARQKRDRMTTKKSCSVILHSNVVV